MTASTEPRVTATAESLARTAAFGDAFGDPRISALADVVLSLALEVFELRMRVEAIGGGADASVADAERDGEADAFAARLLAPFANVVR